MPQRTLHGLRKLARYAIIAALFATTSIASGQSAWDESPGDAALSSPIGPEFWDSLPPPAGMAPAPANAPPPNDSMAPAAPAPSEVPAEEVPEGELVDGEVIEGEVEIGPNGEKIIVKEKIVIVEAPPAPQPSWFEYFTPDRFEAGGTMTSAQRDSWTLITKGRWIQELPWMSRTFEISGKYARQDEDTSANEWIFTSNYDIKHQKSPWVVFNKFLIEYDELERLNMRVSDSIGLGYRWFDEDWRKLITRMGPTVTYEDHYRPDSQEWEPELLCEVEGHLQFERMTFEHTSSAYPNVSDFSDFRLVNDTGLLLPLDAERAWSAKLGFKHTYLGQAAPEVTRNQYTASFSIVYKR